jgi:hypothetical protein
VDPYFEPPYFAMWIIFCYAKMAGSNVWCMGLGFVIPYSVVIVWWLSGMKIP